MVSVLPAEVFERSVGNKRIQELELPFSDQFLSILDGYCQEFCGSLPGIGILLDDASFGSVVVISIQVVLVVQIGQRTAGDSRITNSQHAARNEVPESSTTHTQQLPQSTLRPSVFDPSAHPQGPKTEAHSTHRPAETFGNFRDRFVAGQIQESFVVLFQPWTREWPMKGAVAIAVLRVLLCAGGCQCWRPSQLPYAPPAISSLPSRHQFEDFVDCVVLLLRTEFDASDQKLIYDWLQARVRCRLASNVLDNARHIQNRAASQRAVTGVTIHESETRITSTLQRSA